MKGIITVILAVALSIACTAENRPVTVDQLPAPAKEFINANYPGAKVSYAFQDDDLIRPDYTVRLENGVEIVFNNDGSLEKISTVSGVPESLVPVQIRDYVKMYYQDVVIVEYEIGRKEYDVKLDNGLELTFDSRFRLRELDD